MLNKISAQTKENYRMIFEVKIQLSNIQKVADNQTNTLKLMTGALVVIVVLLAIIAWS